VIKYNTFLFLSFIICFFGATFFSSCSSNDVDGNEYKTVKQRRKALSNAMLDFNAARSIAEFQIIDSLAASWNWNSEKMTGGIVYEKIQHPDTSKIVEKGDTVSWHIKCSLINGLECYSLPSLRFVVGHSNQPQAFEELALKMHSGDSIRALIPSLMAYGTKGLHGQVPPGALLVLHVRQN